MKYALHDKNNGQTVSTHDTLEAAIMEQTKIEREYEERDERSPFQFVILANATANK